MGAGKAVDIADADKAWSASRRFWLIIGAASHSYGLGWGGCFGLSRSDKRKVLAAIQELREAGWPSEHPAYRVRIGFDPAHLQTGGTW